MSGRRLPFGLRVFRVAFWAAVITPPLALALVVHERHLKLIFNTLNLLLYSGFATAIYQLILRFIYLAGGSEEVEQELRDSEGRVELNLRDRR